MARGKDLKKKRVSKTIQKEYKIMTLEEVRARESKYVKTLSDLKACLHLIDEAYAEVEALKHAQNILQKWETYLRCENLPNPQLPPDVRLFFVKLRFFEAENIEKNIDWLLSVDECSILSQDIFHKDLTKKTLINEISPNFGLEYEKNVSLALQVLNALEYYLEDENRIKKAPKRILMDISEQKTAIHQEIIEFFDRFTYRIISSEVSYMSSVDAITSEYFYECEYFQIHIWTLKNVPIRFSFLEELNMGVNLHNLNIILRIPHSILEDNLTLRAVHFTFDHFSEHAKSYFQEINVPTENLSAGISDLHECLINEWGMQVEIQTEARNKMIQKRFEYDERIKAMEADLEKQKKEKKHKGEEDKKAKKKKVAKPSKEPLFITEDMYPDISDEFLEKEQREFEDFINIVYHPNVLKLTEDEINLKKYSILGGIYQMYFVKKPVHYNFNDFNMTWHQDHGNLVTIEKHAEKEPDDDFQSYLKSYRSHISHITRASDMSIKTMDTKESETTLYVVTFELPKFLCRWGEPLPCHYEADLVGFIEKPLEENPEQPAQFQAPVPTAANVPDTQIASFQINPALHTENTLNVHQSSSFAQSSTFLNIIGQSNVANFMLVEDFDLNKQLTKYQIRCLQRHCLPRIISSLKFPIEIKDEEAEKNINKTKGAGGTLIRKRTSLEEISQSKINERVFTYENQNNPERIYPYFQSPEPLNLPFKLEDYTINKEAEPQNFSDLILIFDYIKKLYLAEHHNTTEAPPFKINPELLRKLLTHQQQHLPVVVEEKPLEKKPVVEKRKARSRKSLMSVKTIKAISTKDMIRRRSEGGEEPGNKADKENSESEDEEEEEEEEKDTRERFTFSHWTKEYITKYEYDKENCKIKIWTDRLGIMGFAYKRYEHFPFRYWSVAPSEENPETEVVFTLETQFVKCVIFVTAAGFRGYVTEPTKRFVRHRLMYLVIEEPITDFKELKKRFREKYLNIFSEHDARFYIENGYFSEKHLATELHTYSCMAVHSISMRFTFSQWNRLAKRRDIVLNFGHYKETEENMMRARITPEEATFVEITELCSNDLDVFNLQYTLTWRNIDHYVDLHHLIVSSYPAAVEMRVRDPKLIYNLKNFLCEVRPLSYS